MYKFLVIPLLIQCLLAARAHAHAGPHGTQPLAEQLRHFALDHWMLSFPLAAWVILAWIRRKGARES